LEPPQKKTDRMMHKHSDYMHWAKTQSRARFNLATSGVGSFPLKELPFACTSLEINGENSYGYVPLKRAIAGYSGVDPDSVVMAAGTSFANYVAMATILEPGDEVLIEHPAYGLLVDAARYITGNVKRFARGEDDGYALDPAAVRQAISPRTKLIVLTNLHNPSSAELADAALREVIDLARSVGARVLVDEVYLDAIYENTPKTSFLLGPEVVVTSSLTKVYGLSGIRCGWILAEPDLARAMWQLNNLFAATPVHPGELISVAAFEHLDIPREKARRVVEADRKLLNEFLDRETGVSAVRTQWGTTSFVRLVRGDVDAFLDRLRAEFETSAVPGRFFEMPDHFRIGMGVNTEMFAEGLHRISAALAG
jgi:aspartate/methionine/tyrosine aminotransferase